MADGVKTVTNLDIPVTDSNAGGFVAQANQDPVSPGNMPDPIGMTNLNMFTGLLFDPTDPNPKTQYLQKKIETFRAMQVDPTISGALQGYENILSVVEWVIRNATQAEVEWDGKGSYSEEEAKKVGDFVKSCFSDMAAMSLNDIMSAALDMLPIGFQIQAPQFKIRQGRQATLGKSSKYDDGRIGWSFWKTIDQESVYEWLTPDGEGFSELSGINQQRITGGIGQIPRDRFLLFRTTSKGDSPEGESILLGAVCTWQALQNVLNIELVSLSRNLEGIPVARIPSKYLSANATVEERALVQYITKVVRSVKYNEQTGLVLPSDLIDETSERMVDIELMTAGGSSRIDACRQVALAKESLIAESILAMFLKTGSGGGGGSYALSSDLTDLFVLAMRKYLDSISQVINKEAIIRLLEVNGMDTRYAPVVEYSGLDKENVAVVVDGIAKMIASGAIVPSKTLQQDVMNKLDLNTEGADAAWDDFEKLQADLVEAQKEDMAASAEASKAKTAQANNKAATIQKSKNPDEGTVEVYFHPDGRMYEKVNGKLVLINVAAA